MYGRLTALPDKAEPLQRAQLMAVLSVGASALLRCAFSVSIWRCEHRRSIGRHAFRSPGGRARLLRLHWGEPH